MDGKGGENSVKADNPSKTFPEGTEESMSVSESASTVISSPGRKHLMMAVNSSLQSLDPLSLLKPVQQEIQCTGDDNQSSFAIYGNDVTVFPCEYDAAHKTASSKIRFSQVCKYDWDQRYYFGNLLASSKKYVAYVVGGKSAQNEHVRVINHITSSRVLLKGFEGKVVCLLFGGPDDSHIACMDMMGDMRIFVLVEDNGSLKSELVLEVLRHEEQLTEFGLVSWAPMMIDDDDDDQSDLIIAITYKNKADVLSVNAIVKEHGNSCSLEDISKGRKSIRNGHSKSITQFAVSPNYEILATSSLDGFIKMWNINFDAEEEPSCQHEWQPHDGEPVTSLFFCDNHMAEEENVAAWRFLITGAMYNTEIKVWCSVTWKCLQVLRFCANPSSSNSINLNPQPRLKVALDKSALFFILSDVKRQVLYVLQLYQNSDEGTAHFTSLTECILTQPMLCYSLYHTRVKKIKTEDETDETNEDEDDDDDDHERDENGLEEEADVNTASDVLASSGRNSHQVSLKMFGIHVKSLQKLHIKYTPSCSVPPPTPSVCTAVSSEDHMSIRDAMSDITEGQGNVMSDQEDNDSFATAALKIAAVEESLKSSASSLTAVTESTSSVAQETVHQSSEKEEQDAKEERVESPEEEEERSDMAEKKPIVYEDEKKKSDTEEISYSQEEKEAESKEIKQQKENTEFENDGSEDVHSDEGMSLSDFTSVKPKKGVITILKRPGTTPESGKSLFKADSCVSKSKPSKKGAVNNELVRKELMAELGISSPKRSVSPTNSQYEEQRMSKKENFEVNSAPSLSMSSTGGSMTIETGDLLGLGFSDDIPFEQKKSGSHTPEVSSQPIGTVLKMLQDQQNYITQLTKTVQDLSKKLDDQTRRSERLHKQQAEEREQMKAALQMIQRNSGQGLNKAVKEFSKVCTQRLESFNASIQADLRQSQERQSQTLVQALNSNVGKIDGIVKAELKNTLMPNLQKPVNFAMEQISSLVSTRLLAIEKVLREELAMMVKSKVVTESIGFSAAEVLESRLPNVYREVFENVLIPSYEQSCSKMFAQISREFEKGTKAHFERMDSYFSSRKQRDVQSRDPVLKQLQGFGQTFQDTADRLTGIENNLLVVMEKQITDSVNKLKTDLVLSLDEKLSTTMETRFEDMIEKIMIELKQELGKSYQGMVTAQGHVDAAPDLNSQINKQIEAMDYLEAFNIALNAGDLDYVLYVCQRVDAEELFTKNGSALSQPVILSLIQQLSIDLTNDTEVKANYLSEAITALDITDEITAEFMPKVLDNLCEQINGAMSLLKETDPDSQYIGQLKILRQVVRAAFKGANA